GVRGDNRNELLGGVMFTARFADQGSYQQSAAVRTALRLRPVAVRRPVGPRLLAVRPACSLGRRRECRLFGRSLRDLESLPASDPHLLDPRALDRLDAQFGAPECQGGANLGSGAQLIQNIAADRVVIL